MAGLHVMSPTHQDAVLEPPAAQQEAPAAVAQAAAVARSFGCGSHCGIESGMHSSTTAFYVLASANMLAPRNRRCQAAKL